MIYRRQAGRPYNFFLKKIGVVLTFYKRGYKDDAIDNGIIEEIYTTEKVVPMHRQKNQFQQNTTGQQSEVNGFAIRSTNPNLKGCFFTFKGQRYEVLNCFNTDGEDEAGRSIYHYELAKC